MRAVIRPSGPLWAIQDVLHHIPLVVVVVAILELLLSCAPTDVCTVERCAAPAYLSLFLLPSPTGLHLAFTV